MNKKYINWLAITFGFLFGIIVGMLLMHFIYVYSFERILNSAEGIIQEVNININETEVVNRVFYWVNFTYSDKFSNITYTNYSNRLNPYCNGVIDKECTGW